MGLPQDYVRRVDEEDAPMAEDRARPDDAGRGLPSSSDTGGAVSDSLARQLSEFARSLQDQDDVQQTLDAIVHAAAETVPGAQEASLSIILKRREVQTRAATSDLPRAVDHAQYATGQGPCLDTLYEHETVRLPDMATEQRWPEFAKEARQLGVASMLSLQLYVQGDDLGALNLFSWATDAFSDESERIGLLFAAHAGVAMADAQQQEHLRRAIDSRDLIGQAKGILMERYHLRADPAFAVLVRVSQATNRKLTDICAELTDTGSLPET
jgi:transcriptional regulator with GAF, ATPase, and Fis domain